MLCSQTSKTRDCKRYWLIHLWSGRLRIPNFEKMKCVRDGDLVPEGLTPSRKSTLIIRRETKGYDTDSV